jgi:hypothetical protein
LPPRAFDPDPLPWRSIFLGILPFVLNMIVIAGGADYWLTAVGVIIAVVFLLIEWSRSGAFPVWGLLLLGYISFPIIVIAFIPMALLMIVWMARGRSLAIHIRAWRLPRRVWFVLALWCVSMGTSFLSTWVTERDMGALFGVGVIVAESIGILGLTIGLGLLLARRFGLHAMLFVVGAFYPFFIFSDPTYALGLWTDNWFNLTLLDLVLSTLFIIVPPLILLRARLLRGRMAGLLLPVGLCLVLATVVPNMIRPYMTPLAWLHSSLYSMDLFLALLLGALIYHHAAPKPELPFDARQAVDLVSK